MERFATVSRLIRSDRYRATNEREVERIDRRLTDPAGPVRSAAACLLRATDGRTTAFDGVDGAHEWHPTTTKTVPSSVRVNHKTGVLQMPSQQ